MRHLSILVILTLTGACAAPKRPVVTPGPSASDRLAAADALVRAGCFDCLASAYREYDALRRSPAVADLAMAGAIRASALLALREREMGMVDDGYLEIARDLAGQPGAPAVTTKLLDIVGALPGGLLSVGRPPSSDADLERSRILRTNRAAWKAWLRESTELDELAAYAWTSLLCGSIEERDTSVDEIFAAVSTFRDAPLLAFRRATCRGVEPEPLTSLRDQDSRFIEVSALLGAFAVGRRDLDEADKQFQVAYDWHPQWPRVTLAIANVAMTGEEFDRALEFYDTTLSFETTPDALLGKVRALTYLARYQDAITTVDVMLAERWYPGDGRYWRALNEASLEQNDAAWVDVEAADKLLINAEVPKLTGIIAYRRQQLDVARGKFDLSHERNAFDCETTFYLGVVLAEQRAWERTAAVLTDAVHCLDEAELALNKEIATIRASKDPPARQARQIARREQLIVKGRRMIATSWFNTAVAYFSLSRNDDARLCAEKVADDEQFGARAREILSRLK
ncbi:MAG: hypothetical protein HY047_17715 [Acidobacteria bacterium]|nr:hypothetical protein [Acidobacteriota bacterium]